MVKGWKSLESNLIRSSPSMWILGNKIRGWRSWWTDSNFNFKLPKCNLFIIKKSSRKRFKSGQRKDWKGQTSWRDTQVHKTTSREGDDSGQAVNKNRGTAVVGIVKHEPLWNREKRDGWIVDILEAGDGQTSEGEQITSRGIFQVPDARERQPRPEAKTYAHQCYYHPSLVDQRGWILQHS